MAALQLLVVIPSELLLRLFFQEMIGVRQQLGDRIGRDRVVIAANLAVSVHQNHSCAVQRLRVLIAAISGGELEAFLRQFVDF